MSITKSKVVLLKERQAGRILVASLDGVFIYSLAELLSRVPGLVTSVAVNLLGWVRLLERSVECDGQPYSTIPKSKSAVNLLPLWGNKDHHQFISRVTRATSGSFSGLFVVESNKPVLAKPRVFSRELEDGIL